MELVARQMMMLLSDYKAFNEAYNEIEDEDVECAMDIEDAMLEVKWKLYFGEIGSWKDFYYKVLIDDPTDGEFLFYLADYLKDGYCNMDVALQQALSVVWMNDEDLKLMYQSEIKRCYRRDIKWYEVIKSGEK